MAIHRLQQASATFSSSGSPSVAWPRPTQSGNWLFVAIATDSNVIPTNAAWSIVNLCDSEGYLVMLFVLPNAASRSGPETFSLSTPGNGYISVLEYAGISAHFTDNFGFTTNPGTILQAGAFTPSDVGYLCLALFSTPSDPVTFTDDTLNVIDTANIPTTLYDVCLGERIVPSAGTFAIQVDTVTNSSGFTAVYGAYSPVTADFFADGPPIPMFIDGIGAPSKGMPLYIPNIAPASGSMTLYEDGHLPANEGPFPLYLEARGLTTTDDLPLFMNGSSTSGGFYKTLSLFLECDQFSNTASGNMNLVVVGPSTVPTIRNMNLWVGGVNPFAANGLPLTCWNNGSGMSLSAPMFVSGDGSAAGALPATGSLNLFLARMPANGITLFTKGPGAPISQQTTLFARGAGVASGNIPLVMPFTVGAPNLSTKLFTRGF